MKIFSQKIFFFFNVCLLIACLNEDKGKIIEYWPNHTPKTKILYKSSNDTSSYTIFKYSETGKLEQQENYSKSKRNGITRSWYDNQQLKYEELYENGSCKKLVGWYENGSVKEKESQYLLDSVVYFDTICNCEATLIRENGYFENWYQNGIKKYELKPVDSIRYLKTKWDSLGNKIYRKEFKKGEKDW